MLLTVRHLKVLLQRPLAIFGACDRPRRKPDRQADVFGLAQRGVKGDGHFRPGDGGGYVAYKKADYAHALSRGDTDVQMLLFETFGGWSAPVTALFKKMRDKVQNKLSKKQYEESRTR